MPRSVSDDPPAFDDSRLSQHKSHHYQIPSLTSLHGGLASALIDALRPLDDQQAFDAHRSVDSGQSLPQSRASLLDSEEPTTVSQGISTDAPSFTRLNDVRKKRVHQDPTTYTRIRLAEGLLMPKVTGSYHADGHVLLVAFLLANAKALSMRPPLQAETVLCHNQRTAAHTQRHKIDRGDRHAHSRVPTLRAPDNR